MHAIAGAERQTGGMIMKITNAFKELATVGTGGADLPPELRPPAPANPRGFGDKYEALFQEDISWKYDKIGRWVGTAKGSPWPSKDQVAVILPMGDDVWKTDFMGNRATGSLADCKMAVGEAWKSFCRNPTYREHYISVLEQFQMSATERRHRQRAKDKAEIDEALSHELHFKKVGGRWEMSGDGVQDGAYITRVNKDAHRDEYEVIGDPVQMRYILVYPGWPKKEGSMCKVRDGYVSSELFLENAKQSLILAHRIFKQAANLSYEEVKKQTENAYKIFSLYLDKKEYGPIRNSLQRNWFFWKDMEESRVQNPSRVRRGDSASRT